MLLALAEKLVEISPANLTRVHLRDLSGSTAVEGAIKIAQAATGKRDVVSVFASHHGQSLWTTNISGNAFRRALYPTQTPGAFHVPAAYCFRCFYRQSYPACNLMCVDSIGEFIEYASSGSVACIIAEPVLGNGGNIVPPRDYFKRLRQLCDQFGILLILDEVQTGFGRLGYMFGAEYFEVQPHILVCAKGLSGPVPRAAILVEEGLEQMPRYQHSFSGSSGLISAATALATIRVLQQPGFLERVRQVGSRLGEGLRKLAQGYDFVADTRGVGMMWGLEITDRDGRPDAGRTGRIVASALDHGLILRSSRYGAGNVVKVRPALIISDAELDELLARLRKLLTSVS